jgi:hypothetical protein
LLIPQYFWACLPPILWNSFSPFRSLIGSINEANCNWVVAA